MHEIIVEKPYTFVAPHRGKLLPTLFQKLRLFDRYLAKHEGVTSYELRGIEHLKESLRRKCGILLAPNHCRYADPFVMGWVAREVDSLLYVMASWHLFNQSRFQAWAIRAMGAFSVFREGLDRQSLETAIDILATAERPLIVFPEGVVFRSNDVLQPLLEGVAFLARSAAKRREKLDGGQVVIHPVAIKYDFHGNLEASVRPVLESIEQRLTWWRHAADGLHSRTAKIGLALLALKEIEYLGVPQTGSVRERQARLIDFMLNPLERQWLGAHQRGNLIPRIKQLRVKIVPNLTRGGVSAAQREKIWRDLTDIYLAQQIASYPPDYLKAPTTVTRILETIERYDEDLFDRARVHRPWKAVIEVGPPIEVVADRPPRNLEDPLMIELRDQLQGMLDRLATLPAIYHGTESV